MRRWLAWTFALLWWASVAPSARAEETFPEYSPPPAPRLRFKAGSARIVLRERTPGGVSFFEVPDARGADERGRQFGVSKEELAKSMVDRLAPQLGSESEQLSLEVTLLGMQGRSLWDTTAAVTLEVRARRPEGGSVTAMSASRLRGHLGGQTGSPQKLLTAAALDAFERAVLSDAFIAAYNGGRESIDLPVSRHDWQVQENEATATAHVAGLSFDAGSSFALGLRYLHDHVYSGPASLVAGYGLEARGFSDHGTSIDGASALAIARGGLVGGQLVSLEVGAGVLGHDGRARGLALVGAFLGFYYVELGGTFYIPFASSDPPDWLSTVNFGVRINVPLSLTQRGTKRRSPLPAEPAYLPGFGSDPVTERSADR